MHAPVRVALGHLLVEDAAAGGHPLHVAGAEVAAVAEAVAVRDRAGEDVGDRLDAAMRMPREPGEVVVRVARCGSRRAAETDRTRSCCRSRRRGAASRPRLRSSGLDCTTRLTGRIDIVSISLPSVRATTREARYAAACTVVRRSARLAMAPTTPLRVAPHVSAGVQSEVRPSSASSEYRRAGQRQRRGAGRVEQRHFDAVDHREQAVRASAR